MTAPAKNRGLTAFYSCPLCVDSYSSAPVLLV
nr:MAG TPA: C2H2 type zinc-finger protein [Caudoviricetes sp.]